MGGEAGVGKTRLVAELTSRCAADRIRVLAGGCIPVGDGALPYAPIVEALRALLTDLGAVPCASCRPVLARAGPPAARPGRAGSDRPPTDRSGRLFELLLGLLGRLSEQAPLCW